MPSEKRAAADSHPSNVRSLLTAPAVTLAAWIRRREISSAEVVEAHIARVESVNGVLNALVADRFEAARREAAAADEEVTRARDPGDLPPLLGVPCTIKEFLAVVGMPQTAGLLARRDARAREDATVVTRLRRAGAIPLGVTNVPDGGMWVETHNKLWGRTNNPWDLRRTAGGSSGGEAALIAAGASPFGLGSDIAGSVRIPAAFCGITAHKPTGRLVPNTGHWGAGRGTDPFLTCGPMARSVADLAAILPIVAGPDGADRTTRALELAPFGGDLSEVEIYPVEVGGVRPWRTMRREVRRAAEALAARGARARNPEEIELRGILPMWARAMSEASGDGFSSLLGDGAPLDLRAELGRALLGRGNLTLPALALALIERASLLLPQELVYPLLPEVAALRDRLEKTLGPRGVILHPPFTRPAPRHGASLLTPLDFLCTGVFNILEFPATAVPTGLDGGLPVGVQVAARRGNDALTLAVAVALEQTFGRLSPPTPRR